LFELIYSKIASRMITKRNTLSMSTEHWMEIKRSK